MVFLLQWYMQQLVGSIISYGKIVGFYVEGIMSGRWGCFQEKVGSFLDHKKGERGGGSVWGECWDAFGSHLQWRKCGNQGHDFSSHGLGDLYVHIMCNFVVFVPTMFRPIC